MDNKYIFKGERVVWLKEDRYKYLISFCMYIFMYMKILL